MSVQIPLIEIEAIKKLPEKPANPCELFLVVAYLAGDGRWSVRRRTSFEEFSNYEAAAKFAESLDARWTHKHVVRILISGDPGNQG